MHHPAVHQHYVTSHNWGKLGSVEYVFANGFANVFDFGGDFAEISNDPHSIACVS
jgi:hypothetical protein